MSGPPGMQSGVNFNNLDDIQPSWQAQHQKMPPSHQDYSHQRHTGGDSRQTSNSKFGFCSKQCLIGLGIGLAIGVILVIIIAVPVGVTKKSSTDTTSTGSSTPNWVGTFKLDNACDTTQCCCFNGNLQVTKIGDTQLQVVSSSTTGSQCNISPLPSTLTTSSLNGYKATILVGSATIRCQLGQDSSYITYVDLNYASCSDTALRTSSSSGHLTSVSISLFVSIMAAGFWLMTRGE